MIASVQGKYLAAILVGFISLSASAQTNLQTVTVSSGSFYVGQGALQTVELGGWHYVKNIVVRAQGAGWADATMEVIVNGDVKGTVHVPGRDPSYIVTIADTTSSIQFRQVSGGNVLVLEVTAVESLRSAPGSITHGGGMNQYDYDGSLGLRITNDATLIAARAIELVNGLNGFSDYSDEGAYLLPIKKSAAKLYAKARAHRAYSPEIRDGLIALSSQIDFATPYIENYFERPSAFELATELLSLKEQINELLK